MIEHVGTNKTVLEVGCSTGYVSRILTQRNGCIVDGIEIDPRAAEEARKYCRQVWVGSVEDEGLLSHIEEWYDVITLGDVLEHLVDPVGALKRLSRLLRPGGYLLISLPNVASWPVRRGLFFKGDFDYTESGVLDKTHLHFYTYYSIDRLIEEAKYTLLQKEVVSATFPLETTLAGLRLFRRLVLPLRRLFVSKYPNLSALQLIIKAAPVARPQG
jgi:SAM-dependent methyltransferase